MLPERELAGTEHLREGLEIGAALAWQHDQPELAILAFEKQVFGVRCRQCRFLLQEIQRGARRSARRRLVPQVPHRFRVPSSLTY